MTAHRCQLSPADRRTGLARLLPVAVLMALTACGQPPDPVEESPARPSKPLAEMTKEEAADFAATSARFRIATEVSQDGSTWEFVRVRVASHEFAVARLKTGLGGFARDADVIDNVVLNVAQNTGCRVPTDAEMFGQVLQADQVLVLELKC